MNESVTLKERVNELETEHGGLRSAARALDLDPGYLCRLKAGEKDAPSPETLAQLGLMKVVSYVRTVSGAGERQPTSADGWKEAAIAWNVCASIHREYAKGKDALFITRQADFIKHHEEARSRALAEKGST